MHAVQYPPYHAPQQPGWGPPQQPWGPPQPGWGPPPPQPQTSGPGVTLGILSVCFGSLLVLRYLWDLVSAASYHAMPSTFGPLLSTLAPSAKMPTEALRTMALATAGKAGVMIFMSTWLLVTGLGLLQRRPWARTWSKVWAWAAFPAIVVRLLIWHLGVAPAMDAMFVSVMPTGVPLPSSQGVGFEDFWCVVLCAYPIVLLALVRGRAPQPG